MKRVDILLLASAALTLSVSAARAAPPGQKAMERPIRTLISAVRYDKDALALKSFAGPSQGKVLLGEAWEGASPKQRDRFVHDFQALFAGLAFPKLRKAFEHLETIVYDDAVLKGATASITSTLVVLHPLKKREFRVRYDLERHDGAWKVLDVQVLGTGRPSMLRGIRDEQIGPLMKEGGLERVLEVMKKRLDALSAGS